ncbi:LuxR C-terminal-related transcriptional regulator [Kitasatospora sp. NPDC056446]|uniref:LuxR C-terminal-related transcriptional regulator n=1 Tax=Kitasatospora sp. NPDC056446 TaxID=3345819 RepID=UPI003683591C
MALTVQQIAVLDRAGLGMTNSAIGAAMNLRVDTVKGYLRQAYDRLETTNRVHAFAQAWRYGLLPRSTATGPAPMLSDEQKLILRIWGQGGNRRDIARALEVREGAAEFYEEAVLAALGTGKRIVAVRRAFEHRLIDPAGDTLADLTTPMAADSGQGRTLHHRPRGGTGTDGPVNETQAEPERTDQLDRAVALLHSAHGLAVHLGALAGLPEVPSLAGVLAGAPPRRAAPTVVRLVHQALALGVPCALLLPASAVDSDRAVGAVGLEAAWSCAVRQGAYDGTVAYLEAARLLGTPVDEILVVCTADQASVAAGAGFRRILTTTSIVPGLGSRRAPRPELNALERRIAELAAQGQSIAEIGDRVHAGEYLVRTRLADLRRRTGAIDDAHLVARLITAEVIGTNRLRADLPEHVPELDQAGRAVAALICTGTLSEAGANAVGLSLPTARAVEGRIVRALSRRGSRTHAAAVAVLTGIVTLPPAHPTHYLEPLSAAHPAVPERSVQISGM